MTLAESRREPLQLLIGQGPPERRLARRAIADQSPRHSDEPRIADRLFEDRVPARAHDAPDLTRGQLQVEARQDGHPEDHVERPVAERKFMSRSDAELDPFDETVDLSASPGEVDHRDGKVDSADSGAPVRELNSVLAVATAEVQNVFAPHVAEQVVRVFDGERRVSRRRLIASKYPRRNAQVRALFEQGAALVVRSLGPLQLPDIFFDVRRHSPPQKMSS